MQAVEIKKNIYWVGAIDWDLRDFHGYSTQRGSSYNAYLIMDKKITLVDTVKEYKTDEMIERISKIIDPSKIDYLICNHVEMDHSGALPYLKQLNPNLEIYTSTNGVKGLSAHYKKDWKYKELETGDVLNLGKYSLNFVTMPMVHWPDSMATYIPEAKLLLPNDAFGQHLASSKRFDDQIEFDILMSETAKYYANIVLPFGSQVQKALDTLLKFDIDMIAPSHGIIWRSQIPALIENYKKWSSNTVNNKKAVIVYDTMWNSTQRMAQAIYRAFEEKNFEIKMMNLKTNHISDIMTEIMGAKYICVGSPTLNNNILPTVAAFLAYLKGLAPKNRTALAFGSYGWSGQSIDIVEEVLKSCGFNFIQEAIKINYRPGCQDLQAITDKISKALHQADK